MNSYDIRRERFVAMPPEIHDSGLSECPNWWFENTLSFPGEETSLGSGLPSHLLEGDVPCPSSPSHGFLHHTIGAPNNAL
jgi:hypothetical protein